MVFIVLTLVRVREMVVNAVPTRLKQSITFGFISYPLLKLFSGRPKEVSPLVYVLAVVFVLRYIFL